MALCKQNSLIYLHLQEVMELLTRGRKRLRSAELKVPQLILCSGKKRKEAGTIKGPGIKGKRKHGGVFFTTKSQPYTLYCLKSTIYEEKYIPVHQCLIPTLIRSRFAPLNH